MGEISKPLKAYRVDYFCEFCNVGKMRPAGRVLTSYPVKYPHKCNHCGEKGMFDKTYPYIAHKEA